MRNPQCLFIVLKQTLKSIKAIISVGIERFAFYDAAKAAFAVVQVGDPRLYGCFLFRKGVIAGG